MTPGIPTVSPDAPRAEVLKVVTSLRIGAVPVAEHGRVLGVVSKGDLAIRNGTTARELMTPAVHWVTPDYPIRSAAQRMLSLGVHRLLVMRDGQPLGVVTATNFLKALLAEPPASP